MSRSTSLLVRATVLSLALSAPAGCRFVVPLQQESDAGASDVPIAPDVPIDRPVVPDVPSDVGEVRACTSGVDLLGVAVTDVENEPTLASSGTGADRRYALLVPPAARPDGPSTTRLALLDGEGMIRSSRELTVLDEAGSASSDVTIHRRRDVAGYLVLGPTAAQLLDPDGADDGAPIVLPAPPRPEHQRYAAWIDDARFLYVADAAGDPLVVIDASTRTASTSSVATNAPARVVIGDGFVVVSPPAPSNAVREITGALDVETVIPWPTGTLGRALLGAARSPTRRWLVADGDEFRASTGAYRVSDAGALSEASERVTLFGPFASHHDGDLTTIRGGDEALTVYDFATDRLIRLASGALGPGLVERDDAGGFVVIVRRSDRLWLTCVEP